MDTSKSSYMQGIGNFTGRGWSDFMPVDHAVYKVPANKRAQMIYFRAGNSTEELITVAMTCNDKVLRLFPIGAKAGIHVPLAVVEDLPPEATVKLSVAGPKGLSGEVVYDVGFVEI